MSPSRTGNQSLDDYSEAARSFNNIANTNVTDKEKKSGISGRSTLKPYGGRNSTFGFSDSIWSGGLPATASFGSGGSRENMHLRDSFSRGLSVPEALVDGKTGSGSLVDSSTSEDLSNRSNWSNSNSAATRSTPAGRFPETGLTQQRSTSNAGLPTVSGANQTLSRFASRAPPSTNLNQTTASQQRPSFSSAFSGQQASRDWNSVPVPVYTKLDRLPDSAIDAFTDNTTTPSPRDERRPSYASSFFGRNTSMQSSRDGSLPPSRGADEPPTFIRPDYSRPSQGTTPSNSRAQSVSSARNGTFNPYFSVNPAQTSAGYSSINASSRSGTSQRQGEAYPGPMVSAMRPGYHAMHDPFFRSEYYVEGDDSLSGGWAVHSRAQPSDALSSGSLAERYLPSGDVHEFRPGQPYRGSANATRSYDGTTWPVRMEDWQGYDDQNPFKGRRPPTTVDPGLWIDPRMQQQFYAVQIRNQFLANPYALQHLNPPYMQLLPALNTMNLGELPAPPRDSPIGDGIQSALMYEFKSNTKSKRYELRDIYDHIAEFSGDQHGSRFIQTKLETANSDEKERVFREIEPNAIPLMTDVFGNYVIQKFFEHGDQTHKKILANKMRGQVLTLSLQMYGCRVVQKALDHVLVDQQALLISELENYVLKCVKDQNGNHVIQKAIERCPAETIGFIVAAFQGQVQHLSIHPYGCRVIQRCLEKCDLPSKASIMMELMDGIQTMISDQFGNYVVQHVVAHDDGQAKDRVLRIVAQGLEGYSKHKFASNVVEKCLERSDDTWRHHVAQQLVYTAPTRALGEGVLLGMIKDNFGNYVIQKLLDTVGHEDYSMLHAALMPAMAQAKRNGCCTKQLMSIEKKMHRFDTYRNGGMNGSASLRSGLAFSMQMPAPPYATHYNSAATTPPPLTADTQSLQSSGFSSVNGDAVEGAAASRKGSEPSSEHSIDGVQRTFTLA